ncbi:MAG TPA: tetratricopeptide repeat protein [Pyrinomonadaceae bacterium]|jgi:TolB-like protein/DNA-binding winged helix-turn-helix (wHTH) protein/Tfp pilus assembly protein PilF|nr:tetratricopeptide repeat protein [Pyrinomonadaceae bacterium]
MSKPELHLYEFGPFRLSVRERLLFRGDELVPLPPKVIDTLLVFVVNSGHILEKGELLNILWPDCHVEESSLAQNISLLRKALGERANGGQYIETVPKRGYRFSADVREVKDNSGTMTVDEQAHELLSVEEENPDPGQQPGGAESILSPPSSQNKPRTSSLKLYLLLGLACTLLAGTFLIVSRYWSVARDNPERPPRSIAVLPLKTLNAGDEPEDIGLGIANTLILNLSQHHEITVSPTSTIYRYVNRDRDVYAIGRDLGVEAVLDGTVQRIGERIRITAQLIRLSDGRVLWTGKFDSKLQDIFAMQDSISGQMTAALIPQLTVDEGLRMAKQYTHNTEAYQAYMTGLYFWNKRSKESLTKAIWYFQRAIAIDPDYALAYAGLSDCYNLSINNFYDIIPPSEAVKKSKDAATKAIELDDNLAEAHMAMAVVKTFQREYAGAEVEYQRALALNPNFVTARVRYAQLLVNTLRLDEALWQMRRAQELDPVSPVTNGALGNMLLLARRYDEAVKYCRRALELDPNAPNVHANLGLAYEQSGLFNEAIAEFNMMPEDQRPEYLQYLAYTYAAAGRREESEKILVELLELKERGNGNERARIMPYNIALVYTALDEKDRAFMWLEQQMITPSFVTMLRYDPQLDALRPDSRFHDYLRRHNLENLLDSGG